MDEDEVRKTIARLNTRLAKQKRILKPYHDYYRGDFPLPYVPGEDGEEFNRLLARSVSNWSRKIVDITARRIELIGVQSPVDKSGDDARTLMRVWEASNMGRDHRIAQKTALRYGLSYVQVGRHLKTDKTQVRPLSPMATVHEVDPDDSDRLKFVLHATYASDDARSPHRYWLWSQDEYFLVNPRPGSKGKYIVDTGVHGMEQVPVSLLRNQPDEAGGWASDLEGVMPIQDRINQTTADRLMVQSYSAYKQWLLIGWEPEKDEKTGEYKNTIRPSKNRFIWLSDENVKAFQFDETALEPFVKATEADVQALAALTDTPPHHLLGQMINLSAEALKAAESGLSAKVAERQSFFADAWEDVFRLVAVQEDMEPDPALRVQWKDTEPNSEAQHMDALTKKRALDVPTEVLWAEMGYDQNEIDDMIKVRDAALNREAAARAASFGLDANNTDAEEAEAA